MIIEGTGLGIPRTDKFVVLKVTGASARRKEDFYRLLCKELEKECGISPSDVVVPLVENGDEDWSFGLGRAQFLTGDL